MVRRALVLAMAASAILAGCSTAPTANPALASTFLHIHALAVDPVAPDTVWVATHQGVIRGVRDGNWTYTGDDRSDYMGFSLHPTDSSIAYASGHPTTGGNQGIRKSTDGGATWKTIALPGRVDCHAMTMSQQNPALVYCLNSGGGFYRSTDGITFSTVTPQGLASPTYVFASDPGDANKLLAGTKEGIQVSRDRGETWAALGGPQVTVLSLAAAPGDASVLYANFAAAGLGLQRSSDGGATWSAANGGLPVSFVAHAIAVDPSDGRIVYAAGATTITKSIDGGLSWRVIRSGP